MMWDIPGMLVDGRTWKRIPYLVL